MKIRATVLGVAVVSAVSALAIVLSADKLLRSRGVDRSVEFSLAPATLPAGATFVLTAAFKNLWTSPPRPIPFTVLAASGVDLFLTPEVIAERAGVADLAAAQNDAAVDREALGRRLRGMLDTTPGFLKRRHYDRLIRFGKPRTFTLEDTGCPSGLAPAEGRPPRLELQSEELIVLPSTPPGAYTFRVPANYLCGHYRNGRYDDNLQADLHLTITR